MENYEVIEAQHVETNTYKILLLILEEPEPGENLKNFFQKIAINFAKDHNAILTQLIDVTFQHQRTTSVAELLVETKETTTSSKINKYLYLKR